MEDSSERRADHGGHGGGWRSVEASLDWGGERWEEMKGGKMREMPRSGGVVVV
jgi:hypothetical protein